MKVFDNFNGLEEWLKNTIHDTVDKSTEDIANQVYKDSEQYTYIDTREMYESGSSSDFKKGYVLIKAPQVRWLYFTTGINAGPGNPNAVPMWFERVKKENINSYKKIVANNFDQLKGR